MRNSNIYIIIFLEMSPNQAQGKVVNCFENKHYADGDVQNIKPRILSFKQHTLKL